ncbi:hypothetical protein EV679_0850 [Kerstersia gyiorum]|uniref:Uncharacterized protein n=1 Tax=Kerstersia gyiorum TaxID=206506 RepID=A0A4Q7MX64_9BURK|nr:hypothetical protein [Kerstersia gyiorum]KAB0545122.1 hypothetical protein F7P85_02170 [Kerstersia gyiorum]RZS73651.1 hypothetical protein EV679_0850 [Kerstersia gyiorum]
MNTKLIVILVAAIVAVSVVVINVGGSSEADSKPSAEVNTLPATKGFTHKAPQNSDARYKEY